jgi:hypothetical protein
MNVKIKAGIALVTLMSLFSVFAAGCEKADETTTAPPPVSKEARPDAPNTNKAQNLQPAAGAMQEIK